MTEAPRRPSRPPPYQVEDPKLQHDDTPKVVNPEVRGKDEEEGKDKSKSKSKSVFKMKVKGRDKDKDKDKDKKKGKDQGKVQGKDQGNDKDKEKDKSRSATGPSLSTNDGVNRILEMPEALPAYSSSIDLEGIFMKKHEIEDTTKRAEDRRWHTTFVTLTGTALNLYTVKKNRTWGTRDGPTISPDNPPWMRKSKLEKSYSLLYADAGIAADYKK